LENLAEQFHYTLEMHEFDLLRGEDQDVLDIDFWTSLVDRVRKDPILHHCNTTLLNLQSG